MWDSLKPWVETPINYEAVKTVSSNFRTLISENDPFTSNFEENAALWKERIGAHVTIAKEAKHFNGIEEPTVLKEIEELIK